MKKKKNGKYAHERMKLKNELYIETLICLQDNDQEKLRNLVGAWRAFKVPFIANWIMDNAIDDERVRISLT